MGELLRRGFDAQLADRNTAGYDLLVGSTADPNLRKIQVKTVRTQPWYVKLADFEGDRLAIVTIYVLLGPETTKKAVKYFMARNGEGANAVQRQATSRSNGLIPIKPLLLFEDRWDLLKTA